MAEPADPTQTTQETDPASAYQPQWSQWTRQLVIVGLIIAGIYAFTLLRPVIQMLTMAFILAFLLFSPSRAIARRTPIPYGLAVTILYAALILVVVFLILVFIPAFVEWVNRLVDNIEQGYATLYQSLQQYEPAQGIAIILGVPVDFNFIIQPVRDFVLGSPQDASSTGQPGDAEPLEPGAPDAGLFEAQDLFQSIDLRELLNGLFNVAGAVTSTVTSAITSVAGFAITLLMALFLSFLILLDLPKGEDAVVKWIPPPYYREFALLLSEIVRVWNGFFRGQVLIGVIIGVATWLQLALMGIAGAEVLAIFTGAISLIPTIGGIIALVPMALVPLFQGSSVFTQMSSGLLALLVVGVSLVIQQVIWNVIAPKILGEALDLPLPVIIVGVFIGAAVGGILGAFLVAPIMGTLRVLLFYMFSKLGQRDPFPGQEAPPPYKTFGEARPRIPPRREMASQASPRDRS